MRILDQGDIVILVGNPGVGKTHTVIDLGITANVKMKNVSHILVLNVIIEFKESIGLNQLTN